jgi:hypothetical protein
MSAELWLGHLRRLNPYAEKLFLSQTREEFLDAAEHMIERQVQRMEQRRDTYRKLGEVDLSKLLVELLGDLVPAEAEADQNGHVDVLIKHPRGLGFRHLTECKIWNGVDWHRSGREGRTMCLAFFVRHRRMKFLLERLRRNLASAESPAMIGPSEDHPFLTYAFTTHHEHPSGALLGIVHAGCHLWQDGTEEAEDPNDSSTE